MCIYIRLFCVCGRNCQSLHLFVSMSVCSCISVCECVCVRARACVCLRVSMHVYFAAFPFPRATKVKSHWSCLSRTWYMTEHCLSSTNKQGREGGGGERASVNVFTSLGPCQSARHRNSRVYFAISLRLANSHLVLCGALTFRGSCSGDLELGIAE